MVYAVIRVRGTVNVNPKIKKTLELLRLSRTNHCSLIPENDVSKGMLQIAKDYVTWGEADSETLASLIETRGMLVGDKPLTVDYLKDATSYKNISSLADDICKEKITWKEIPEAKPVFRLHPPRKGYEGIKRSYKNKGALGYRGANINVLIKKML